MTDQLNRRNSVTKQDYVSTADAGVWLWQVFDPGSLQSPVPTLPRYGTPGRDLLLAATLDLEDMWASAVNKAVTKIAVKGYEVSDEDDSARRVEFGKQLVVNLDGPAEYRAGMARTVQDFLLTDNGWFVEIERVSKSPGSKVKALWHLDSARCYRTGNLDYPVIYWDSQNVWHKLRADQVICGADMPSPRAQSRGRGRCAASRAFATISTISATKTYYREKITGSRALALYFITGVSHRQLSQAIESSDAEQARKGLVAYKGAVMVPVEQDTPITVATVELASVADGFDVEQVEKDGYRTYALAIGLNPDELVERAAGLNSGQSAQVAENAAEEAGGLPYFIKDFEDKLNYLVMPKTTIFQLKTNDIRDQKAKADLDKVKADTVMALLGTGQAPGAISQQMALQLLADEGIVPKEFLPQDVTPGGVLTDSGDQSKAPEQARPALLPAAAAPPPALPTMKDATEALRQVGEVAVEIMEKAEEALSGV